MFRHDSSHTDYTTDSGSATNNVLWSYTTRGSIESSPAISGGFVYISSLDHNIYCINAQTGSKVWNFTYGTGVSTTGYGVATPAVSGGIVYVGSYDNKVYAFGATGIKVTVADSSGKPIVGASVSSTSTPSGQAALSGVSGSDGSITFNGVTAGSYVTNSASTNVVAGSVATSSITLQTQSTGGTSSGGIPGYTYGEILAGIFLGVVVLLWARRRQ